MILNFVPHSWLLQNRVQNNIYSFNYTLIFVWINNENFDEDIFNNEEWFLFFNETKLSVFKRFSQF